MPPRRPARGIPGTSREQAASAPLFCPTCPGYANGVQRKDWAGLIFFILCSWDGKSPSRNRAGRLGSPSGGAPDEATPGFHQIPAGRRRSARSAGPKGHGRVREFHTDPKPPRRHPAPWAGVAPSPPMGEGSSGVPWRGRWRKFQSSLLLTLRNFHRRKVDYGRLAKIEGKFRNIRPAHRKTRAGNFRWRPGPRRFYAPVGDSNP